jgi:hypothetical protein
VVPVKVYLDASSRCEEALPNITFHATEMAGGSQCFVIRHFLLATDADVQLYNDLYTFFDHL